MVAVTVGTDHSCALGADRRAYCWGGNASGQLGDGTEVDRVRAAPVAGSRRFGAIAAGAAHSCGVAAGGGDVYCWGRNRDGQLGDGSTESRSGPARVASRQRFVSVTAGLAHTCALTAGGAAYCWGSNDAGQLGDGTSESRSAPVRVEWDEPFAAVRASGSRSCGAVARTGAVVCWGDDGAPGAGTGDPRPRVVSAEPAER